MVGNARRHPHRNRRVPEARDRGYSTPNVVLTQRFEPMPRVLPHTGGHLSAPEPHSELRLERAPRVPRDLTKTPKWKIYKPCRLVAFSAKRADQIKILSWDGTGSC